MDEIKEESAWNNQIGGNHYKSGIQPFEYAMSNNLDALQFSIVKYVTRFRKKNGITDLEKAKHCLEMLMEWENRKVDRSNIIVDTL